MCAFGTYRKSAPKPARFYIAYAEGVYIAPVRAYRAAKRHIAPVRTYRAAKRHIAPVRAYRAAKQHIAPVRAYRAAKRYIFIDYLYV